VVAGPQADMGDEYWGSLYGEKFGGMMKAAPKEVQKTIKKGDFNDYSIKVVGKHVTITVNGQLTVDEVFPTMPDEGIIAFQLHGGLTMEATFRNIEFKELPSEEQRWVQLFNGKDLTEWKVFPQGTGPWKVEDGMLVGRGNRQSHLFSERGDYKDFHFRVEAMINDGGNSGQYFRTRFEDGLPRGWEAQINATHSDRIKTGSLYPDFRQPDLKKITELVVRDKAPHKPDEWFVQEVIAKGDHITILVNGKKTVDWIDPKGRFKSGHFALQLHDSRSVVRFRKIEVKELTGE
jgi:hypothetical protein